MSFFELFQPGLRYLREEKDRQKMLVAQPKFGRKGGPLGIDLEGGKATFAMPTKADQDLPDPVEPGSSSANTEGAGAHGAGADVAVTDGGRAAGAGAGADNSGVDQTGSEGISTEDRATP